MKPNARTIILFVAVAIVTLTSCSMKNSPPDENGATQRKIEFPQLLPYETFGPSPEIIEPNKLFELTTQQKSDFFAFRSYSQNRNLPNNQLIADYLQSHLKNFNYYSDTFTARDALIKHQGNCLSLAILTKALAKLVDVEVSYQLVETEPVFQKEGNLILTSQHVRTKLLKPLPTNKDEIVFIRGGIVVDYFPERGSFLLRGVEEPEFFGMYYRNKAAEALINDDLNRAFWLVNKTLQLNQTDPHGLNMMALIHSRKGAYKIAEQLYLYGLQTNEDKLDLLDNYHTLLVNMGRNQEAKLIAQKLEKHENKNPFKWISLANQAYNERKFDEALTYYRKARRLAPYLHQAYAGIAQAELQLGNPEAAQSDLQKAKEKSHKKETKLLYQRKLDMLTELLSKKRDN